jgi:4-carboxymuconolactone decarboxylase
MSSSRNTRVQPIEASALQADQRAVFGRIADSRGEVAGPFTVLLHVPELADRVQRLGAYLRYEAGLDRDVAELAILVTARACRSPFEWEEHEPIARASGVPDAVIRLVEDEADSASLVPRYRAVVDYVRELARSGGAADATYQVVLETLGVQGVVELTVLVGYYSMLAMTLNAHEVPMTPQTQAAEALPGRS